VFVLFQALGVFGLCQIHAFVDYVRSRLSKEQFDILFRFVVLVAGVIGLAAFGIATALGSILLLTSFTVFCLLCICSKSNHC
jgi:hypothetical protein